MKKRILFLFLLIVFEIFYVFLVVNDGLENHYLLLSFLFLTPLFMGMIGGFLVIKEYGIKNPHGKSFLLIFLGFLFFLIGEIIWTIFEEFLGINPFPSIADLFYLLAYPLIFIGLILEIKIAKIDINAKKIGILLISFLILGSIFFKYTILEQINFETNFIENLINICYGVGDIVLVLASLLLFLVVFEYRKGKIFLCWIWFLLNFIAMLVGDLIFAIFYEVYDTSILITSIADVLWITSYGLFAIGMFCFWSMLREERIKIQKKLNEI